MCCRMSKSGITKMLQLLLSIAFGLQYVTADTQFDRAFVRQPHNASLIEGSDHVLICDLSTSPKEVKWLRKTLTMTGFELFAQNEYVRSTYAEKFSFPTDSNRINYRIILRNASISDEGFYMCVACFDKDQYESAAGFVQLLIPPRLTITSGNETNCTAGTSCRITCEATFSYPEPKIEWLVRGLEEKAVCEKTTTVCPGLTCPGPVCKKCTALSCRTRITTTRSDHESLIACQASGPAIRDRLVVETRLSILFEPVVRVEVHPDHVVMQEKLRAVFSCVAESRPSPELFRWSLGKQELPCANSTCVKELMREHHGKLVVCTVTNAVGSSSGSLRLEVAYPPRFTHQQSVYFANEGEPVKMKCEVDANPSMRISWFKKPDLDSILLNGTTFSIERLSGESFGEYICVAYSSSELYQSDHATSIYLIEKFAPRIAGPQQVYATLERAVEITCRVDAAPLPKFVWSRNGVELKPINDSFSVSVLDFISGRTSILKMRSVQPQDIGDYNCTATNELGAIDVVIRVSEHKPYLQYIVLLGIGVSVVIVSTICAALLVYYAFNKRNLIKRLWAQGLYPDSSQSSDGGTRCSALEPYELTSIDAEANDDSTTERTNLHESLINSTLFDTTRTGNANSNALPTGDSSRPDFKSNTKQLDSSGVDGYY